MNRLAIALGDTERRRVELISEVAHEMRTPLTTIDGYVEGMLDGVFEPTEEVLTAVAEETLRLKRLATDLSSLSRVQEGAMDLERERVDLGAITLAATERLRPQFDAKGVALDVGPIASLGVDVDVDVQRITQVLTNLLGNALTYTGAGGRVAVTVGRVGDSAVVTVADTGVGLTREDLELVFDRFFRVAGPRRPAGGSGIGLTIARSIARLHGGDVEAASPGPGRGSTFTLRLPVAGAAAVPGRR